MKNNSLISLLKKYASCPVDKSKVLSLKTEEIEFENGLKYPIVNGKPILIDEKNSLFKIEDSFFDMGSNDIPSTNFPFGLPI